MGTIHRAAQHLDIRPRMLSGARDKPGPQPAELRRRDTALFLIGLILLQPPVKFLFGMLAGVVILLLKLADELVVLTGDPTWVVLSVIWSWLGSGMNAYFAPVVFFARHTDRQAAQQQGRADAVLSDDDFGVLAQGGFDHLHLLEGLGVANGDGRNLPARERQ